MTAEFLRYERFRNTASGKLCYRALVQLDRNRRRVLKRTFEERCATICYGVFWCRRYNRRFYGLSARSI